jgi:hypothetical protein
VQLSIAAEKDIVIPVLTRTFTTVELVLETVVPERDVQTMAERDRTGNGRLSVFVYVPQGPLKPREGSANSSPASKDLPAPAGAGTSTLSTADSSGIDGLPPGKAKRLSISTTSTGRGGGPGSGKLLSPGIENCSASCQVFGVSLDESAEYTGRKVPALLRRCLKALTRISIQQGPDGGINLTPSQELDLWYIFSRW